MTSIANQGKTIGDNPPNYLNDKNAACYSARQDQPFPFMRPVLMFVAMLVFDVIIIYAMDVFDGFSPVKFNRTRIFTDYMQKSLRKKNPDNLRSSVSKDEITKQLSRLPSANTHYYK